MLINRLDNQKRPQEILADLLYKEGYCLCIPDPKLIKSYFEQVHPTWIQEFLLRKNAVGLSVIPMFMLIFVKNKYLTKNQSKRLFKLVCLLITQADACTVEHIVFDNKVKQMAWGYYILKKLTQFTLEDFIRSKKRITIMAKCMKFFFEKTTGKIGFQIIRKIFYYIAYENLHSRQIVYLSNICKGIIDKVSNIGIETLIFQKQLNGFSFLWCALETWLQIIFDNEIFNLIKIKHFTFQINMLLEKTNNKKLSEILLENEGRGCLIILRYIFLKQSKLIYFHDYLEEYFDFFHLWCEKIFSTLAFHQIEWILENILFLLSNDLNLSTSDERILMQQFFDYLLKFSKLEHQERFILTCLQKRLEKQYFLSNKIIKLFKQMGSYCHFFKNPFFRCSINNKDELFDESSDLMSHPGCARLSTHYSSIRP